MHTPQLPVEYLVRASKETLESFELTRLNRAANFRKEAREVLNDWVQAEVESRLARFVLERRRAQSSHRPVAARISSASACAPAAHISIALARSAAVATLHPRPPISSSSAGVKSRLPRTVNLSARKFPSAATAITSAAASSSRASLTAHDRSASNSSPKIIPDFPGHEFRFVFGTSHPSADSRDSFESAAALTAPRANSHPPAEVDSAARRGLYLRGGQFAASEFSSQTPCDESASGRFICIAILIKIRITPLE